VHKCLKSFVIPLVACEAVIILLSGGLRYFVAGQGPFDLLAAKPLAFMLTLGLGIALVCFPLCRMIGRVWGTLVGLCLGVAVPIVTGLALTYVISHCPLGFFNETSFEALIGGFVMSIPGGIAGAVVGFLVARPAINSSAPPSRSGEQL